MLVLTRKENESIVIGGQIRVTVLCVRGGQIRLGIEAPKDVPICRSELLASVANPVVVGTLAASKVSKPLALAQ
jgi:carbon storage regulator